MGILQIFTLLGALGMFLYGMNLMSSGLQKAAGDRLRGFLSGMSVGTLFSGVGLSVVLGLVVGKFVGVFSFSWVAVRLKVVSLPAGTSWKAFASVSYLDVSF